MERTEVHTEKSSHFQSLPLLFIRAPIRTCMGEKYLSPEKNLPNPLEVTFVSMHMRLGLLTLPTSQAAKFHSP